MKKLLMFLFLMQYQPALAEKSCMQKVNQAQQILAKKIDKSFSLGVCFWLRHTPHILKSAVIIAYLETTFRNVVSNNKNDWGYFQFSSDTLEYFGIDPHKFMKFKYLQPALFTFFMHDKLMMCAHYKVPEACWHSATPEHYERYKRLYLKAAHKLRGIL